MDKEQKQIEEFMDKAQQFHPTIPTIPNEKTVKLRLDLIIEETKELAAACGYELTTELAVAKTPKLQEVDLVEVADALTDINYVTKGMGSSFGIDLEPMFELVHKSNMDKFGPGGYRRDDGKWMKSPDWVKPNLAEELDQQKIEAQKILNNKDADFFNSFLPERKEFLELYPKQPFLGKTTEFDNNTEVFPKFKKTLSAILDHLPSSEIERLRATDHDL